MIKFENGKLVLVKKIVEPKPFTKISKKGDFIFPKPVPTRQYRVPIGPQPKEKALTYETKKYFAVAEVPNKEPVGDWLQLTEKPLIDMKKKYGVDKSLTLDQIKADPQLYEQVANIFVNKYLEDCGLKTWKDKAIWSWRPNWYKKYGGDINKVPNVLVEVAKGQWRRARDVLRQRKRRVEEYERQLTIPKPSVLSLRKEKPKEMKGAERIIPPQKYNVVLTDDLKGLKVVETNEIIPREELSPEAHEIYRELLKREAGRKTPLEKRLEALDVEKNVPLTLTEKLLGPFIRTIYPTRIPLAIAEKIAGKKLAVTYKELSQKSPVSTAISGILGDLYNLVALGRIFGPLQYIVKLPRDIGFAWPYLNRLIPEAIRLAATFGTKGLLDETITQFQSGKFDPERLATETGKEAVFGSLLAGTGVIKPTVPRILATGGMFGGWTTLAKYIKNGKIDKKDLLDIGSNILLGIMFETINARGVTARLKQTDFDSFLRNEMISRLVMRGASEKEAIQIVKTIEYLGGLKREIPGIEQRIPRKFKDIGLLSKEEQYKIADQLAKDIKESVVKEGKRPSEAISEALEKRGFYKIEIEKPRVTELKKAGPVFKIKKITPITEKETKVRDIKKVVLEYMGHIEPTEEDIKAFEEMYGHLERPEITDILRRSERKDLIPYIKEMKKIKIPRKQVTLTKVMDEIYEKLKEEKGEVYIKDEIEEFNSRNYTIGNFLKMLPPEFKEIADTKVKLGESGRYEIHKNTIYLPAVEARYADKTLIHEAQHALETVRGEYTREVHPMRRTLIEMIRKTPWTFTREEIIKKVEGYTRLPEPHKFTKKEAEELIERAIRVWEKEMEEVKTMRRRWRALDREQKKIYREEMKRRREMGFYGKKEELEAIELAEKRKKPKEYKYKVAIPKGLPAFKGAKKLTTKVLEELKGKTIVSKRFIFDQLNREGIKQAEKDIIIRLLQEYPEGKKVPVKEFAEKVEMELLPLKVGDAGMEVHGLPGKIEYRYPTYVLPEEKRGMEEYNYLIVYREIIYQSPIKNNASEIHWMGDFPNYFAHVRYENIAPANIRRILEIQSDLFQKGRIERELEIMRQFKTGTEVIYKGKKTTVRGAPYKGKVYLTGYKKAIPVEKVETIKEYIDKLQPYRNTWHERIIREEIRRAAEEGFKKLRFPTGETAMIIEGLGEPQRWLFARPVTVEGVETKEMRPLKERDLKVGLEVTQDELYEDMWIVTDVLGEGKFKAVPKEAINKYNEEYWEDYLIYKESKKEFVENWMDAGLSRSEAEGRLKEVLEVVNNEILNRAETFDISGKIDTSNPIYRFYESEVQKYLKKIKPEMKRIKDKQGVEWFEIPIEWEDKTKPIYAFKAGDVVAEPAYNISIKEAKKIWSKFFNENEVKFIAKKQLPPDPQGRVVYGRYADALVEVVEKNGKIDDKVLYHEAFHAYVDLFVDEKTKKELFTEYSEEELADGFADYVATKKAPTTKIKSFFKKLLAFIKKLISKQNKVETLFDDIITRKRARRIKKPTPIERFKAKRIRSLDKIIEEEAKYLKEIEPKPTREEMMIKQPKGVLGEKIKVAKEEYRRISPHSSGYRRFYKKHKRAPRSLNDWKEIAREELEAGRSELGLAEEYAAAVEKIEAKKPTEEIDVEAMFEELEKADLEKAEKERIEREARAALISEREKEEFLESLSEELQTKIRLNRRLTPKEATRVGKALIEFIKTGGKKEKVIGVPESKLLKLRLRAEARGARWGLEAAREKITAIREEYRKKIKDYDKTRERLYKYIKKNLPPSERGKALARLKSVKTEIGLKRAITYTQNVLERYLAKKEMKKMIKEIKKIPTSGMSYDYRKKIEGIKEMFDLKRRTERTLKRREKLLEFVLRETTLPMSREEFETAMKEKKEVPLSISTPVPRELIMEALRKPLNQLNIEEVRTLHKTLMNLAHLGRTKHRLLKVSEKREIKKQQKVLLELADKNKKKLEEIEEKLKGIKLAKEKTRWGRIKYGMKKYYWKNIRPERILEKLDGYKEFGEWWKTFYEPINKATNQEVTEYHQKEEELVKVFKDLKINTKKLFTTKREKINERIGKAGGLTPIEKIGVYLGSLDEDKTRYLILKKNFTEQDIRDVVDALTPKEKALGDWLLSKYNDPKEWEEINKVHVELFGFDMGRVKNYSRIFTKALPGEIDQDLANEMLERYRLRRAFVERGFTYERTKTALKDISLDAIGDYIKHIQQVAHFKAFAPIIRDYNRLLLDSDFREKMIELIGEEPYVELVNYIKDIASKKQGRNWTSTEKFLLKRRAKAAPAMIGFNILSWTRQPVSVLTAMAEGPVHTQYIIKGMEQFSVNPKKITKFVEERSPQVKYRFVERVIREMEEIKSVRQIVEGKRSFSEKTVSGVRLTDKATVVAIWKGMYDMVKMDKVKGIAPTEESAIRYADYIIRKTQPMGYTKDLPAYFRGGPTEKLFTMFMNMANQSVNYQTHDIIGKVKAGQRGLASAAWATIFSVIITALILGMIERGRLPRDWKELARDLAAYPLGGWFIVGGILRAGLSGYTEYGVAPLEFLNSATRALGNLQKGKWEKTLYAIGQTTAMWSGIPWNQPYRTIRGALDWIKGETTDLRRLIWSEWTLKEKDKSTKSKGFILKVKRPSLQKRSTIIKKRRIKLKK